MAPCDAFDVLFDKGGVMTGLGCHMAGRGCGRGKYATLGGVHCLGFSLRMVSGSGQWMQRLVSGPVEILPAT